MNNHDVFQPNNHSKWQVSWKPVSSAILTNVYSVLLTGYGISDISAVQQVDEWEWRSNNFKIVLDAEKGFKKFLLRKNIVIKSAESLELMEKLSTFLREQAKISTPRTIKTGSGILSFHHRGFFYQLFEFIEGNHFRGLEEELFDFAGNLGLVHTALYNFPITEGMKTPRSTISLPQNRDGWAEIFSCCQRQRTDIDLAVASVQDLILRIVDCTNINRSQNIRQQVIKGDQHPLNTLYENGKLVALLDFDEAELGELIKDVGNACHRFVRQYVVFQGGDWRKTLPCGLDIFFNRYHTINPLTTEERQLMPLAISDGLLRKIYSRLYKYYVTAESEKYSDVAELRKLLMLLQEAELINDAFREII